MYMCNWGYNCIIPCAMLHKHQQLILYAKRQHPHCTLPNTMHSSTPINSIRTQTPKTQKCALTYSIYRYICMYKSGIAKHDPCYNIINIYILGISYSINWMEQTYGSSTSTILAKSNAFLKHTPASETHEHYILYNI